MNHLRKQIKDEIVASLKADLALASVQIFKDRVTELGPKELPAIVVHNINSTEAVRRMTASKPSLLERIAEVFIDVAGAYSENAVNAVDELAGNVEKRLFGVDSGLSMPLFSDLVLNQVRIMKVDDVNAEVALCRMSLTVKYRCKEGNPFELA